MSDDLDRVIDAIARGMTEGAAPSELRARVLARLATNPGSQTLNRPRVRWLWTLAPIAAAALIIVAAFVARDRDPRHDRAPETPARHASNPPVPPTAPLVMPDASTAVSPERVDRAKRIARAPSTGAFDVDALAPAPIETPSIDVGAMTTDSIAIPPLETIAPIPVAPLATPEGERP
jgi:hypothetical protein